MVSTAQRSHLWDQNKNYRLNFQHPFETDPSGTTSNSQEPAIAADNQASKAYNQNSGEDSIFHGIISNEATKSDQPLNSWECDCDSRKYNTNFQFVSSLIDYDMRR